MWGSMSKTETELSGLTGRWLSDFSAAFTGPKGWALAAKTLAGTATLIVAVVTIASFLNAQQLDQSAKLSQRISTIQAGLLSENTLSRITALRDLVAFSRDQTFQRLSSAELRSQAWWFPRDALVQTIMSTKTPKLRTLPTLETTQILNAGASERLEILVTLHEVGLLGWNSPKRNVTNSSITTLDLRWISDPALVPGTRGQERFGSLLKGFDFSRIPLNSARLDCLVLTDSSFREADLRQVVFASATIEGADFSKSILEFVQFAGANLRGARFDGAQVMGSSFAPIDGPTLDSREQPCAATTSPPLRHRTTQALAVSFVDSRLYDSDFTSADLGGAVFRGSLQSRSRFSFARLIGADFQDAQLGSVSFLKANLEGANFSHAVIGGVDFTDSILENADFLSARFVDDQSFESLTGASTLSGANFAGAVGLTDIQKCRLLRAGAVFVSRSTEWSRAGRQTDAMEPYMLASDRSWRSRCQSTVAR